MRRRQAEPCDELSLERNVRQLLADKVSGNLVGIFLLIPEYLRLGVWDLLCGWTGCTTLQVQPRVALQLVNEGALCNHTLRYLRSLSQRGFELANGLPFVASDPAVHYLLDAHTVAEAQELQIALGQLRRANGHFPGRLLALDPHRIRSYTQRQTCRRKSSSAEPARKVMQTFFCLDTDTSQPIAFVLTSAGTTVEAVSPQLLRMAQRILNSAPGEALVLADREHYSDRLIRHIQQDTPWDILMPLPESKANRRIIDQVSNDAFTRRWAGYATAQMPFARSVQSQRPYWLLLQRDGESPPDLQRQGFVCTRANHEVQDLAIHYPARWHVEEFFNLDDAIGWNRAGTLNINVRYGHMTTALIAQAAVHQLRQRLNINWSAQRIGTTLLAGLQGDLRVKRDTIVVTYYNADLTKDAKANLSDLPDRLSEEGIDPHVPWLYNLKLDFRFK